MSEASAKGIHVYSGYGMSETCPLLCLTHLRRADGRQSRTSAPPTGSRPVCRATGRSAIIDADGNFLAADGETQGELVLRAPWLTEGYLKEPQKGAELWQAAGCTPATWPRSTAWA
jgi:fatty-acyl-CoA synthase